MRIIPSIASADQLVLKEEILRLGDSPCLHIDIEDSSFVPNITFGLKTVKAIASCSKAELDAHLMVANPGELILPLRDAGIRRICVHIEPLAFPARIIEMIRAAGMEAGLALTMKTPVEQLLPYQEKISYVLILSSEPDGEERFNPFALKKIRNARDLLPHGVSLWVDGGINSGLLNEVKKSGADTVIMGRALWQSGNPKMFIEKMLNPEEMNTLA
jgi:ribulose-phosphate 3-epimerase